MGNAARKITSIDEVAERAKGAEQKAEARRKRYREKAVQQCIDETEQIGNRLVWLARLLGRDDVRALAFTLYSVARRFKQPRDWHPLAAVMVASDLRAAQRFLDEMGRVAKPGGAS
jgi:hypothetical protein